MEAATEVLVKSNCLWQASAKYSVNFTTLHRFCKKLGEGSVGK